MKDVTIKFKGVAAGEFKMDATQITVPEEQADQVEALVQSVYDAAEHVEGLQTKIAGLEGERDTLEKKVDEAQNISPERLDAMSEERRVIMDVAEHVGFKRDELKSTGNAEIKAMVVRKDDEEIPVDAEGPYLDGCFRQIQKRMDREQEAKGKMKNLGDVTRPNRTDADTGEAGAGDELTYREAAELKTQNLHEKTDEELRADGWRVN